MFLNCRNKYYHHLNFVNEHLNKDFICCKKSEKSAVITNELPSSNPSMV